ncbi:acetate/propionate family kinase [Maritimibacter sp. UBA3975]|uniref:acetate/propionate family kinase n=1 Tax=Maritimibacter sp. UBA3975 TaxID=1946833 RepID=UPI000C091479|nr:acetate/propionate family kinase [Maritimibacter sp. UBA3975]MAM62888.1 acetate kinase [Maritimibacter sp.]|tara:strand:+ start:38305 stop:39480 length:1176 start_codon:yes stop_codon:yes gene_type:complete
MAHLLVLNAGSSSLKFGLYDQGAEPEMLCRGLVDRIGGAATVTLRAPEGERLTTRELSPERAVDHAGALADVLETIGERFPDARISAVGHRVVHGGMDYAEPVVLTSEILADLEGFIPFAPLHQPHNLAGIRAALEAFPQAVQVACFDTAFHRGHPFVNDTFALPRRYYESGVRRYGFHGLSYDYVSGALRERAPDDHAGRVVIAHLGNGASMCGLHGGKSVASSMGFSALDGLPMGTRSGQLDPGVVLHLMTAEGMDADAIERLLYKESGLLGMSGESHDMRTLLASDNPHAAEAIDYFCFRIRRELGGLAAALKGLDALVFTGGIGENAGAIRASVCADLGWLGIALDPERNADNAPVISRDGAPVTVHVIPTNEERVIARAAAALAGG